MKLKASTFFLLIFFTGSGLIKSGGDYESMQECKEGWEATKQCLKADMKRAQKAGRADCLLYCGQPMGLCVEGQMLTAPGIIFPFSKKEWNCDD